MKVLIFNTLYYPNQIGGAEKSVQLLAEGLLKAGIEVIVVSTSNKDYVDHVNGVKVYYVKTTNLYWVYGAKEEKSYKKPLWHFIDSYNPFHTKIEAIFDEEAPDIVHTNNLAGFSVSVWKIAKVKDIKIVHTLRDHYLLCPKSTMFKNNSNCESQCFACKIYSIPKKEMSKYVDEIVGISQFILNRHLEAGYFKNANKSVIFNSIHIPDSFKKEKKNYIVFGYVGALAQGKGIELLLENMNTLNIDNTKLHIYGKGITKSYEAALKQKYNNDKIIFKGFHKTEDIYKNIDILIVPSLWNEAFGRIVPEANSYKVPVLVSNRGGLPELVKNGETGFIFDPDSPTGLKEGMEKILMNYSKMKNNCLKHAENFSNDNHIMHYTKIYRELLS